MTRLSVLSVNFWQGDNGRLALRLLPELFPEIQFLPWDHVGVPDILVSSVFGPLHLAESLEARLKLLYSAENLARFPSYSDPARINQVFDTTFGFTQELGGVGISNWLIGDPRSAEELEILCEEMTRPTVKNADRFCCLIARSNIGNKRAAIYEAISEIGRVACPGRLFNNEPPIPPSYAGKVEYMRDFSFNICPENSLSPGYTTEKLFHAAEAGCIPIYWGHQPSEPDLLNNSRVIRFDPQNVDECVDRVRSLWKDKRGLAEFISQPAMVPGAGRAVRACFERLRSAIPIERCL